MSVKMFVVRKNEDAEGKFAMTVLKGRNKEGLGPAIEGFIHNCKVAHWQPVPKCMLKLSDRGLKGILGRAYIMGYLGSPRGGL